MQHLPGETPYISRSTLRLTIRTSEKGFELASTERLQMITPPQPGERPEPGKHGGHWIELRDRENRPLAHRVINATLLNSAEVHSPKGVIRREFGKAKPGVFEVLLPDMDSAAAAVLMGEPFEPPQGRAKRTKSTEPSGEIARFELFSGGKEGGQ